MRAKIPEAERHERVNATHRRVELPAFGRHVGYALHDPDARFLGLNLGWISASCERIDPPQ